MGSSLTLLRMDQQQMLLILIQWSLNSMNGEFMNPLKTLPYI